MSSKVPNFPIQSAAAIRLATEAAKAKCDELGNRGFYKVEPELLAVLQALDVMPSLVLVRHDMLCGVPHVPKWERDDVALGLHSQASSFLPKICMHTRLKVPMLK